MTIIATFFLGIVFGQAISDRNWISAGCFGTAILCNAIVAVL